MASRIAKKLLSRRLGRLPGPAFQETDQSHQLVTLAACLLGLSVTIFAYWVAGLVGLVATIGAATIWAIARSQTLANRVESLSHQLTQPKHDTEPSTGEDGPITRFNSSMARSIRAIDGRCDPLFRQLARLQLSAVDRQMSDMAVGRIVFVDTESWRTAYEQILATPGLKHYLSAAWLRSEDYWRDAPGRHSIRLNYDLVQLGLRIERTLILNDFFWPEGAVLPAKAICRWIEDQYKHGLTIRLVRESEIAEETDLLADFGIYGDRATGALELDDRCRSLRYTLDFSRASIDAAENRWRRLQLFSHPFRELLDRALRRG